MPIKKNATVKKKIAPIKSAEDFYKSKKITIDFSDEAKNFLTVLAKSVVKALKEMPATPTPTPTPTPTTIDFKPETQFLKSKITEMFKIKADQGLTPKIVELLKNYDAARISLIKPELLESFYKDLKNL